MEEHGVKDQERKEFLHAISPIFTVIDAAVVLNYAKWDYVREKICVAKPVGIPNRSVDQSGVDDLVNSKFTNGFSVALDDFTFATLLIENEKKYLFRFVDGNDGNQKWKCNITVDDVVFVNVPRDASDPDESFLDDLFAGIHCTKYRGRKIDRYLYPNVKKTLKVAVADLIGDGRVKSITFIPIAAGTRLKAISGVLAVNALSELPFERVRNFVGPMANAVLSVPLVAVLDEMRDSNAMSVATAGIMSRNMSHNLGSHVLSRLGQRESGAAWYTQRYLQQRMDFVAQIATDWPDWEEPTWLLQDLVRWFLHQAEILENIAASEDLQAHQFSLVDSAAVQLSPADQLCEWVEENVAWLRDVGDYHGDQDSRFCTLHKKLEGFLFAHEPEVRDIARERGDIRFHALLVPDKLWSAPVGGGGTGRPEDPGVYGRIAQLREDCRNTARSKPLGCVCTGDAEPRGGADDRCHRILFCTPQNGGDASVETARDLLVAIPGGLIGYHALYVILENLIRNAAKHGTREKGDPLDVVVEVLYDPDWKVWITSGEKQGGQEGGIDGLAEHENGQDNVPAVLVRIYDSASRLGPDGKGRADGGGGEWDISEKWINDRLRTSLIDERGAVRKENWGLAEMRVAAAYLQCREIAHMGSGSCAVTGPKDGGNDVMRESAKKLGGSPYIIRAVKSPIGTLGYEFYLRRPREVAIVSPAFAKS